MSELRVASRRPSAALGVIVAASLILVGVVMAKEHEPIAVEPDAPRPKGVEVATFALG